MEPQREWGQVEEEKDKRSEAEEKDERSKEREAEARGKGVGGLEEGRRRGPGEDTPGPLSPPSCSLFFLPTLGALINHRLSWAWVGRKTGSGREKLRVLVLGPRSHSRLWGDGFLAPACLWEHRLPDLLVLGAGGFLLPTRHSHTLAHWRASCLPFFSFRLRPPVPLPF